MLFRSAPVEQAAPQEAPVAQQGREDVGRIISMTKAQYREDPETRGVSSSSAMQIEPAGKTPKQLLEQYGERDVRLLASLYGITVKDKNTVAKKLIDLHNSLQELGQYTAANLRSLTLAELKPLAKENGIQPVGTKEEIIRRILAFPEQTRLKFEDRLQDAKHTTALLRAERQGIEISQDVLKDYPEIGARVSEPGSDAYKSAIRSLALKEVSGMVGDQAVPHAKYLRESLPQIANPKIRQITSDIRSEEHTSELQSH